MKLISIVGDSISTFEGWMLDNYAVYYDKDNATKNGLTNVNDTWWSIVIDYLNGALCVNNSFSGSCVAGKKFPASSSDERCLNLHNDNQEPNIVLIYMGFNDFAMGLGIKENPFFSFKPTFYSSYIEMLKKIKNNYPQATVICGTLMKSIIRGKPGWVFPNNITGLALEEYNKAIKNACDELGIAFADLYELDMRYETIDGSHPTKNGHSTIAEAWIKCLSNMQCII